MNRINIQLGCATGLLFAAACGDATTTVDSAVDVPLAAATEAVYTVGAVTGEDWETFGAISGIAFDADGNLHVLDAGAYRVVVVDAEGGLLRTVGSRGDGPGEMSMPWAFAVLDDGRTAVFDMGMPGNFEVFGPDGGHVETVTADMRQGAPGRFLLPLPDGRMVSTGGMTVVMGGEETAEEPEDSHFRDIDVFSLDGSDKTVLHRAWDLPPQPAMDDIAGRNEAGRLEITGTVLQPRAFEPPLHIAVLSDGRVAVVDSVAYRIKLLSPDGSLDGAFSRPVAPEPVTEAVRTAYLERAAEQGSRPASSAQVGPISIPAEVLQQMMDATLSRIQSTIFPDEIPVIAAMAVDREGRVWVEREAPGGYGDGPTDILAPDGEYVGTIAADGPRIPDAFGPNGLMAYVERDEMDVPSVRVVRLVSLEREE